jgi:predicted porin
LERTMNKKLLAVAIGAALAASPFLAAQADVKVKGRVEVELVNVDGDNIDTTQQGDDNGQSRLEFDAEEDLGNGLKAIGRLAFQYDPSNGDGEVARDQWAGLKGGFGTVKVGRLGSTYKMYGGVTWDPYVATFLQARRGGGMNGGVFGGHNSFVNDIIEYTTPKLGGFTLQAQYVADDTDPGGSNNVKDGSYNLGGKWKGGPVEVIAVTSHQERDNADALDNSKVGARFTSGGLTAYVQYEDVDNGGPIRANGNSLVGNAGEGSFLVVGAGYKFGNNLVAGNVGGFDADNGGSDVDYFALGLTHFFSKKTRVYAGYANTKVDNGEDVDLLGAGIRFDF